MLEPLNRCRRHSTLFQFTSKPLRGFIDPNHMLIQIDEQLNFPKLFAHLEQRYCPALDTCPTSPTLGRWTVM